MDDEQVQLEQLLGQFRTASTQHLATQERLQVRNDQWAAASKVPHDVNNQLLVIHYACRQLLAQVPENDPIRSLVTAIEQARNEAAAATKTLRSPATTPQSEKFDLNQIIRDVETLFKPILPDGVIFTVRLAPTDHRSFGSDHDLANRELARYQGDPRRITRRLGSIDTFQRKSVKQGGPRDDNGLFAGCRYGTRRTELDQIVLPSRGNSVQLPKHCFANRARAGLSPGNDSNLGTIQRGISTPISFHSPTESVANEFPAALISA